MKTIAKTTMLTTPEYRQFIEDLKARVTAAHISAARAVNRNLILLYWDIGRAIVEKQQTLGWGESVVDRVSRDLKEAFPATTGFSPRNLRDMKRFYLAYADEAIWPQAVAKLPGRTKTDNSEIPRQPVADFEQDRNWPQPVANLTEVKAIEFLPQAVAEIPWGHHRLILDKITDPAGRLYYLRATARFGWSRNVLLNQIKAGACERAALHRRGGISLAVEVAERVEGKTADGTPAFRGRPRRPPRKERQVAMRALAKEAEKMLERG